MNAPVRFYFLCEGSSDEPLTEHLETLISRQGIQDVLGVPRSGGGSVRKQLQDLRDEQAAFDFVVVHRDADGSSAVDRLREVRSALDELGIPGCPVVPVQMTEAWLLVDEAAIRSVVGHPSGREPLGIPKLAALESTHDPKSLLRAALVAATGSTGRRHKRAVREWTTFRRILLQRLDIDGPIQSLASWQQLVADLETAVDAVRRRIR